MPDVKKLIAGFLVLAAGASSSVLIFSDLHTSPTSQKTAIADNVSTVASNAFAAKPLDNTLTPEATNNPDNLTGNLTGAVLNGIMAANPNGPVTDTNGDQIMTPPNQKTLLASLSDNASLKNFTTPDWNAEAAAQKLNIVSDTASATIAYLDDFNNIFQKDITQTDFQSIINQNQGANADPDSLGVVNNAITDAFNEAVQMPTPANLVDFQKSFIKFLTYQKNSLQTVQDYSDDPMKASLTLQAESSRYQTAIDQFKSEAQNLKSIAIETDNNERISMEGNRAIEQQDSSTPSFFNAILGIPTAYASGPVWDIPTEVATALGKAGTWEQLALQLKDYAEQIALQLLKNDLIFFIQNKVLAWVNGGGEPRFIQQWADTFANVGIASADAALDQMTNMTCSSFGPQIYNSLYVPNVASGIFVPAGNGFNSCPPPMQGVAFQNFYNNFSNGGWNSYFAMLEPTGNFYTQLMNTQDQMLAVGSAQESAAVTQATANQGFTGDEKCADGSNPNGSHQICVGVANATIPTLDLGSGANLTLPSPSAPSLGGGNVTLPSLPSQGCSAGQVPETVPNGGLCADGSEPQVTTPGQTTGQILSSALDSNIKLIVNANNIVGIVTAAAQSLISNILQTANASIVNSMNGNDGGMVGIGNTLAPTSGFSASMPLSCSPATTTAQIQTTQNGGGVSSVSIPFNLTATGDFDANGNEPTYTWSAPGASPATGIGDTFSGSYSTSGIHTVTLSAPLTTNAAQTVSTTCEVAVTTDAPVSCSPSTQTVYLPADTSANTGNTQVIPSISATVTASNGSTNYNGNMITPTYSWTLSGAATSTVSGPASSTLTGTFDAAGTYTATVTASTDDTQASCQIDVKQQSVTTQP